MREHQQRKGALPKDDLFLFDPPFFEKADRLYRFYFQHDDHVRLRDFFFSSKKNGS